MNGWRRGWFRDLIWNLEVNLGGWNHCCTVRKHLQHLASQIYSRHFLFLAELRRDEGVDKLYQISKRRESAIVPFCTTINSIDVSCDSKGPFTKATCIDL